MAARHPSPAVYRRRRIVFFVAVLLVLAVIGAGIWVLIAQPWAGSGSEEAPEPSPSASETAVQAETPSAEPSPVETQGAAPCQAGSITVEAVTDAESYEAGALPQLSIRLTNTGAVDCTIDVGSATQAFTVTSGEDVWWRSTDCQENPSSMVVTLTAGQSVSSATPVEWDRTRSDVSTCDQENRSRAPAGGASYHVAVSIGGFDAARTRQILLY
ncbi:hypothetical protein [uncultured Microbacterium sp.]|uniref:hypothetical protein n=1 Tax=uncultured Microbacterium sp. TaxID=191216 RepID=UPI00261C0985|nr:hypothetical protein [uncultured Microbacterium sp.]